MKLHLPKLLLVVVLSCSTAYAEEPTYIQMITTPQEVSGDLKTNHIILTSGEKVTVTGNLTIDSNIKGSNACQLQMNSALEAASITFKRSDSAATHYFPIFGKVKTDEFIVTAEGGYSVNVNITSGGSLQSYSEGNTGTFKLGENTAVQVGCTSENYPIDIGLKTEVDGADLNVYGYTTMAGITLKSGSVSIKDTCTKDLGAITMEGGTLSLDGGATITSAVTMNNGIINVGTDSTISSLTINGATLSDVSGCTVTMDTGVEVKGGELTADKGELTGTVSDSKLTTQAGSLVSADVTDSEIIAEGGEISGTISGTSSVEATSGTTTISGANNDYSGGTVINGATLKLEDGATVGTGAIELASTDKGCGVFDMGGNALTNKLIVTGCIIRNAENYKGDMEVSHELVVEGAATAKTVTLKGKGTLVRDADLGGSMATDEVDVQTDGNASLDIDLTINDGGKVRLNDGKVLSVKGALTLGNGVSLALSDNDYGVGDKLLSSTGTLTMGDVTLVYNDSTVELELQGNSLVLVSKFKQDKADAVAQGNWGIASASRAFVNTVRGQHSNTGCIANGRGTVWAAAFGAYNDMDGADIDVKGAAVGVDTKVGDRSSVGLAVGYADGEVSPAGLRDVDQEGTYVALYGEHGLKKLSATSCLSLDWVAAYGNTESDWNGMDWEQDSLQLNTRLNWNKKVTDRLCMSVFGGLEYFASESDTVNGVKTGSIQNLRGEIGVGARYVAWGAPALTDGKGGIVKPGCEKLVFNGEIRYMNDLVRSNPVIRMNGLSGDGENPGRQGMGIEAGATYRIGERWSASANYGFNAMEDSKEHRVNVGASYTF